MEKVRRVVVVEAGARHFGGIIDAVELHRGRARMIVDDDHT